MVFAVRSPINGSQKDILNFPPEITEPPRRIVTVDGKAVTLSCRVIGAPKPEVRWFRNDDSKSHTGRYTFSENGDLVIQNVTFSDAGRYTCCAENEFGVKKANGTLIVMNQTRITDEPQNFVVSVGYKVSIRCNAVADSALDLTVKWLRNDEEIDLKIGPRYVQSNDYTLTISDTMESDSGLYTCVASTEQDEARSNATLIVRDVPTTPRLIEVKCNFRDAFISWKSLGTQSTPILRYTIQYNTSFTPDTWDVAFDDVPPTESSFAVSLNPWANYTFRILAINKIGQSLPSSHSNVCTTGSDVPFKNPDNVKVQFTQPNTFIISWTPMPEIEHSAPRFQYRVYWKRDTPNEKWNTKNINDWQRTNISIIDQEFLKYRIKVLAINELGESNIAATEVVGYFEEGRQLITTTTTKAVEEGE